MNQTDRDKALSEWNLKAEAWGRQSPGVVQNNKRSVEDYDHPFSSNGTPQVEPPKDELDQARAWMNKFDDLGILKEVSRKAYHEVRSKILYSLVGEFDESDLEKRWDPRGKFMQSIIDLAEPRWKIYFAGDDVVLKVIFTASEEGTRRTLPFDIFLFGRDDGVIYHYREFNNSPVRYYITFSDREFGFHLSDEFDEFLPLSFIKDHFSNRKHLGAWKRKTK